MEHVATKISYWFLKRGYITDDQVDDIRYGLEVVISNILPFITIVILGAKFKHYLKTPIFLLSFIGFRTLRDRYHAPTFLKCYFLTVGSFLLCLLTSLGIKNGDQDVFTLYVVSLNYILMLMFKDRINEGQDGSSNSFYNSVLIFYNLTCFILQAFLYGDYAIFMAVLGTIIIITSIAREKES